jgi:hypothetical protein
VGCSGPAAVSAHIVGARALRLAVR